MATKNIITTIEPSIVVKLSRTAYIEIKPYQRDLFDAAFKSAEALHKAVESQRATVSKVIVTQYADVSPTYAQFRADRTALRALSLERGLVDDQYIRKVYNACIIALYKVLPASTSEAAIKKQAQAALKKQAKGGARKGVTQLKPTSDMEALEQLIAKMGTAKVLHACAKILATSNQTKLDARTLEAVASHFEQKTA